MCSGHDTREGAFSGQKRCASCKWRWRRLYNNAKCAASAAHSPPNVRLLKCDHKSFVVVFQSARLFWNWSICEVNRVALVKIGPQSALILGRYTRYIFVKNATNLTPELVLKNLELYAEVFFLNIGTVLV
jgi:hypothetical protein